MAFLTVGDLREDDIRVSQYCDVMFGYLNSNCSVCCILCAKTVCSCSSKVATKIVYLTPSYTNSSNENQNLGWFYAGVHCRNVHNSYFLFLDDIF